jgi:small multidrug resistance family-3 protein
MPAIQTILWFAIAAVLEIAGCYASWMWLRLGRSPWWLVPGTISLFLFGIVLTRVDTGLAGRAFAGYGGVYIVSSLAWLVLVKRTTPRATDVAGALVCLLGAAIIVYGARWSAG